MPLAKNRLRGRPLPTDVTLCDNVPNRREGNIPVRQGHFPDHRLLIRFLQIARDAKADAEISKVGHVTRAHSGPHHSRGVERGPSPHAAQSPRRQLVVNRRAIVRNARRSIFRAGRVVFAVEVCRPFPDVPMHIAQAPRVGLESVGWRWHSTVPFATAGRTRSANFSI